MALHLDPAPRRVLLQALVLAGLATGAPAATLQVDSLGDEGGFSFANGTCTLREAILAANSNFPVDGCPAGEPAPAQDTILVPPGVIFLGRLGAGEDAGETGDLDIDGSLAAGDLSIRGAGAGATHVEAEYFDRIFQVHAPELGGPPSRVEIRDLTMWQGGGATGGGIRIGLGAAVELTDCEIAFGESGIHNAGELTATHVDVHDNAGDGVVNGGILPLMTLIDSSVRANDGTGVATTGSLQLIGSTVSDNSGAGIRADPEFFSATTQLTNSTVSRNGAELVGDGSSLFPVRFIVINTTVEAGLSEIAGFTVPGTAASGDAFTTFQFGNSILTGMCRGEAEWISEGGNVSRVSGLCGLVPPADRIGVSAGQLNLGELGDNGGPTPTHPIGPASVAHGAGIAALCPETDQRGEPRATPCDAGAFESTASDGIVVDSTADENLASPANGSCTLREALIAANTNAPVDGCRAGAFGADRILLPPGEFLLAILGSGDHEGDLDVTESVEIVGAGARETIVESFQADRVFDIAESVAATLEGLTVTGGLGLAQGGGIYNRGALTLREVSVEHNTAVAPFSFVPSTGGGIFNAATGTLAIERSAIHSNATNAVGQGGGIYDAGGAVTVVDSTFSQNSAGTGGGIHAGGIVALASATVADNVASTAPGLGTTSDGAMTLTNTILDDGCAGTGTFSSNGGNLETGGSTCGLEHPADRDDVPGPALGLSELGFHGGPTMTHAFSANSVALGRAVHAACAPVDQRGTPRDAACDVGSYEYSAAPACGLGCEGGLSLLVFRKLRRLRRRRGASPATASLRPGSSPRS